MPIAFQYFHIIFILTHGDLAPVWIYFYTCHVALLSFFHVQLAVLSASVTRFKFAPFVVYMDIGILYTDITIQQNL